MERWHAKVGACIGVFVIPFVCTILPVKVAAVFEKRGQKGKQILSCLMCFGGGVFFATYMLHMGPEVRDIIHVALVKPYNLTYPVADLLMAVGFFLVMFMEKVVIHFSHKKKASEQARREKACRQINSRTPNGTNPSMPLPAAMTNGTKPETNLVSNDCPLRGTGDCCEDPVEVKIQRCDDVDIKILSENGDGDAGSLDNAVMAHHAEADILRDSTSTRSLVLLVALSLHRIFEGMSVGLQHSTHNVWSLFIAVMCHETVIGFSLGLEFVKNRWQVKRIVLACFLCSLIMPLGTVIGTLVSEIGNADSASFDLMNGILQAIATGTFIYVTFFEILQDEISAHDPGVSKMMSVLLGFVVMAALCTIPEEDDNLSIPFTTTLAPESHQENTTTVGY